MEKGDVEIAKSSNRRPPANHKGYSEVSTSTLRISGNEGERVTNGNESEKTNNLRLATPESFLNRYNTTVQNAAYVVRKHSEVKDIKVYKVISGLI